MNFEITPSVKHGQLRIRLLPDRQSHLGPTIREDLLLVIAKPVGAADAP